ncbi:putative uncharacterized protein DDB_G0290521 [Engraulis encrasicolus]|uniref:putative uncharacterized protein DDB_G0290521 n=1 Tax=Engraulis encrasicolus TaxID=184585 RepID=UPI002FD42778
MKALSPGRAPEAPAVSVGPSSTPAPKASPSPKPEDTPEKNETAAEPTQGSDLPVVPSDSDKNSTDDSAPKSSPSPKPEDTPETNKTAVAPTEAVPAPSGSSSPAETTDNKQQAGQATEDGKEAKTDNKILWVLLPVLVVCVAGVIFILKYKCMKVQEHIEPTENGTENASFQRSESNKDGVMLLGVKSSGAEENAAAR